MNREAMIDAINAAPEGAQYWLDLGWANGWPKYPLDIVARCKELRHKTESINHDRAMHGLHHEVRCAECGYIYHYDSSD